LNNLAQQRTYELVLTTNNVTIIRISRFIHLVSVKNKIQYRFMGHYISAVYDFILFSCCVIVIMLIHHYCTTNAIEIKVS